MSQWAMVNDMNRQLEPTIEDAIDPNGTHICTTVIFHNHRAGIKVDPHLRTGWMVKIKETMEPAQLWIDVCPKLFSQHTTKEEVSA